MCYFGYNTGAIITLLDWHFFKCCLWLSLDKCEPFFILPDHRMCCGIQHNLQFSGVSSEIKEAKEIFHLSKLTFKRILPFEYEKNHMRCIDFCFHFLMKSTKLTDDLYKWKIVEPGKPTKHITAFPTYMNAIAQGPLHDQMSY